MTKKGAKAPRAAGKDEAKKPSVAGQLRGTLASANATAGTKGGARSANPRAGRSQAATTAAGASDAEKLAALTAERARARAESGDIAKRPDIAAFPADETYDPECTRCPRLAAFLAESHAKYPSYWCRPVPSFGAKEPRIALIGLAPGMQGANRTARPFTGDYAGVLLYQTLYDLGLATQPTSVSYDDPLKLLNIRIINAVKCVPPENKPLPDEIRTCNQFLRAEIAKLTSVRVYVALGRIGHDAILSAMDLKRTRYTFGHAAEHRLDETHYLIDSYHCSRYNTQTRRLTPEMFKAVLSRACKLAQV